MQEQDFGLSKVETQSTGKEQNLTFVRKARAGQV